MKVRSIQIMILCLALFLSERTYGEEVLSKGTNRIVAVVDNEIITQLELEHKKAFLLHQIKQMQADSRDISEEEQRKIEKELIEKLIVNKLIMQEAKRQNIVVTEEEINEKIESVRRRFPNEESFRKNLQQAKLTIEDLKESYEYELIMHKVFFNKARGEITVSPREIEDFYKQHRTDLKEQERVKLRNIFIRKTGRLPEEISRKLDSVMTALKEGLSFEETVKKYSEGANAIMGGEMGEIRRGELSPNIEGIIFNLKQNGVSDWIETESGFYLFKMEENIAARPLSFSEAQGQIRTLLLNRKMDERFSIWVAKLKERAYIEIVETNPSTSRGASE